MVAATTMRGHRKQSGSETSWDVYQVWTVRDGTVRAGAGVPKQGDALEAVGLGQVGDVAGTRKWSSEVGGCSPALSVGSSALVRVAALNAAVGEPEVAFPYPLSRR